MFEKVKKPAPKPNSITKSSNPFDDVVEEDEEEADDSNPFAEDIKREKSTASSNPFDEDSTNPFNEEEEVTSPSVTSPGKPKKRGLFQKKKKAPSPPKNEEKKKAPSPPSPAPVNEDNTAAAATDNQER